MPILPIGKHQSLSRNIAGCALAAIIIPVAIVVKILILPFERPVKLTAGEVATTLRQFIDGTGDDYDWDDFICCPIADPTLESIRERANAVPYDEYGTEAGNAKFRALLAEAEALAGSGVSAAPHQPFP